MQAWRTPLFVLATLFLGFPLAAQDDGGKSDAGAPAHTWRQDAQSAGLTADEIAILDRNGFLVGARTCRQIFSPYANGHGPYFVTSDSLLNAFHVLLEESILRMEEANSLTLGPALDELARRLELPDPKLQGPADLLQESGRRSAIVIGVARALLSQATPDAKAPLADIIAQEAERVRKAEGRSKPEWLGPPDEGFLALDYSRYRPRGFYTRSPDLERYFRAVAWLQSIPFRASKDMELATIMRIGRAERHTPENSSDSTIDALERLCECYRMFLGTRDDWDIEYAAEHLWGVTLNLGPTGMTDFREWLERDLQCAGGIPQVNDQIRFAPDDPHAVAEPNFRVLSAYRLPDAVLFQRTTDSRQITRPAPSGLEIAAVLGSTWARTRLAATEPKELIGILDANQGLFKGASLYPLYMNCLRALLDAPEPEAPSLFRTEAWAAKSCQTVLAGWAQMRHTFALQGKDNCTWAGMIDKRPVGFVEPDPEFFGRLAELIERTESALRAAGVFPVKPQQLAARLRSLADRLEAKGNPTLIPGSRDGISGDEFILLEFLPPYPDPPPNPHPHPGDYPDPPQNIVEGQHSTDLEGLRRLADVLSKGTWPPGAPEGYDLSYHHIDLAPYWADLAVIARRVESLAHKQLRGVPFNENENKFLQRYGEQIASVMLYGGNSWEHPDDDAGRIVDICSDKDGNCLEVGIGRPREIYVLYPTSQGNVLSVGAVLSYYEFASTSRLTDEEWRTRLDTDQAPSLPAWLKPISSPAPLVKPK